MSESTQSSVRNRLLAAMPPDGFALLRPHLEMVPLRLREVMVQPGQPIEHVAFVEQGIVSVLAAAEEECIEIGMIGPEGLVGVPVVLGVGTSPHVHLVQAEGEALRMRADALRGAMGESPTLFALLARYVHCFTVLVSHTAFANANFGIEARLARWILMTQDRLGRDELPLTHEFLAMMLGVRRPGVTVATHVLEGNGLIKAGRGRIRVLDRERLRELADTSYGLPEAEYERIVGRPQSPRS
jgi:CRP-like cAMP-binding protein